MTDLADLFPGFASQWVDTSHGRMFARVGGEGPPLLLVHGYPQTHVMWHRIAPELARRFTLVIPDLPGYGWSYVPRPADDHAPHSKRAWALVLVDLMERLGHVRFAIAGHDRGGRVAYRMALDHPGRLTRIAVLDIVPTHAMWASFDMALATKAYHWPFLAQPHPLPERLIGHDPDFYISWTLASWTGAKSLDAFDPRALDHYRAFYRSPDRLRATCEDYRAGRTMDLAHDEADLAAGRKIGVPLAAIWGGGGFPGAVAGPLEVWRRWATDVRGASVEAGHFLCEEAPDATLAALAPFLAEQA